MAESIKSHTLCVVVIHIEQSLAIRLRKPSDSEIDRAKDRYTFHEAGIDSDGDFVASGGRLSPESDEQIRALTFFSSRNSLAIDIIGGTTEQGLSVIKDLLAILYGLDESDFIRGISYITYKTVTRTKLNGGLDGMLSAGMQATLDDFRRFDKGQSVSILPKQLNDALQGFMTISQHDFSRMYEGQENIFVFPTEMAFHIFIPTKYFKMTKYKIQIQCMSFEDFTDDVFLVTTELPYADHIDLLRRIEEMT